MDIEFRRRAETLAGPRSLLTRGDVAPRVAVRVREVADDEEPQPRTIVVFDERVRRAARAEREP